MSEAPPHIEGTSRDRAAPDTAIRIDFSLEVNLPVPPAARADPRGFAGTVTASWDGSGHEYRTIRGVCR
jgi:hypothetical protein